MEDSERPRKPSGLAQGGRRTEPAPSAPGGAALEFGMEFALVLELGGPGPGWPFHSCSHRAWQSHRMGLPATNSGRWTR